MVGKNLLNSIEVTSLALLERARAWEWVKDPLFARGGQGSRKCLYQKKDKLILEKKLLILWRFHRKPLYLHNEQRNGV